VAAVAGSVLAHVLLDPPSYNLVCPSHLPSPSPKHPHRPGHSLHLPPEFPRTRSSLTSRGLGTRVALSSALDGLVHDLDGRLGLPVRVELQVVAFRGTCQRQISFPYFRIRSLSRSANSRRGALAIGGAYPGARKGSIAMEQSALRAIWTCRPARRGRWSIGNGFTGGRGMRLSRAQCVLQGIAGRRDNRMLGRR
jgi:hypothetical protein